MSSILNFITGLMSVLLSVIKMYLGLFYLASSNSELKIFDYLIATSGLVSMAGILYLINDVIKYIIINIYMQKEDYCESQIINLN